MNKKQSRLRRAKRARKHIQKLNVNRLSVHRSSKHIYGQIIGPNGHVLVSASSLEKNTGCDKGSNAAAAQVVGKLIAERAVKAGIKKVAFDRSGFKYHGRVKAFADAAREGGLDF